MQEITLSEILKRRRMEKNLPGSQVARKTYLTVGQIYSYERGKAEPSINGLIRIAGALGYKSLDEFLNLNKTA